MHIANYIFTLSLHMSRVILINAITEHYGLETYFILSPALDRHKEFILLTKYLKCFSVCSTI